MGFLTDITYIVGYHLLIYKLKMCNYNTYNDFISYDKYSELERYFVIMKIIKHVSF